ncbi:hypothetical protein ANCDUO_27401, partial [Ancylostoma duodenale]
YSSYGNENEAPEEGALVEYCRLDKQKQPSVPRICDASTVISAKIRTPPLVRVGDIDPRISGNGVKGPPTEDG